ncbi:MAG: hypothetical protein ACFFEU_04715 [Candidatus Thorarchaeota archaeon]
MSTLIRKISKDLANHYRGYFIAFSVGMIILLIMLFFGGFDLRTLYTTEPAFWLLSVSGVVMKFLSGFGVMLTYASVCSLLFRVLAIQVKGNRKRFTVLKTMLMLPILAVLIYAIYTFVRSILFSQSLTFLENLAAVYGIWSLMLFVYVIPLSLGVYNPKTGESTFERVGRRIGDLRFSLWRGYQSYVWRDYGRVYSAEFERYRETMTEIRAILSVFLLWPMALILMLFPPLGLLSMMLWFRIFSLNYKPFLRLEKILLTVIVLVVFFSTTYLFLFTDLTSLLIYFDLSYAMGTFLSIALLGIVIWQS